MSTRRVVGGSLVLSSSTFAIHLFFLRARLAWSEAAEAGSQPTVVDYGRAMRRRGRDGEGGANMRRVRNDISETMMDGLVLTPTSILCFCFCFWFPLQPYHNVIRPTVLPSIAIRCDLA